MNTDLDDVEVVKLSARLVGLAVFLYGLIVFADEGAGELSGNGGNALFASSYVWGSSWGWPGSGVAATEGLLIALAGFLVLRFKPRESDFSSEFDYVWTFLRASFDTLILFFAWCLTWTALVFIYEPSAMSEQVTEYLFDTVITNTFVMYFSAIMLVLLSVLKLRSLLQGRLPSIPRPKMVSRRFTLVIELLLLCLGAIVLSVALSYSTPYYILNSWDGYFYCQADCYFRATLVSAGWISGVILVLIGATTSTERLFKREEALW